MQFSRGFARSHAAQTLYAVDARGGGRGRGSAINRKTSANKFRGMATSASRLLKKSVAVGISM
jgi:hypothetical protein